MGQAKIKREKHKAAKHIPPPIGEKEKKKKKKKKIFIDISRVPLAQREHPEFKAIFAMMERKLADPREVEAICIHESMHVYYLIKSGVDDFIFTGPTITYDEKKGFDHTGASVQAKSFDRAQLEEISQMDRAFAIGKANVGGGIAVEKLCPEISDTGDTWDRERFDTAYEILVKAGLTIPKDEFKREAERLVRAELDTFPGLKDHIRKFADEFIKDKLFTWV